MHATRDSPRVRAVADESLVTTTRAEMTAEFETWTLCADESRLGWDQDLVNL